MSGVFYKELLNKKLKKNNIEFNDILNKISMTLDDKTAIYFYMSTFEGLGTNKSDIDVYVISNYKPNKQFVRKYLNCEGVISFEINDIEFDVEYWNTKVIKQIINNFTSEKYIDITLLKMLLRINFECVLNNNALTNEIKIELNKIDINEHIVSLYSSLARANYDDAVKLHEAKEEFCALDCCRRVLWNAAAAINAINGYTNLKEKWISKIYITNNAYGNEELLNEYYRFQLYSNVCESNLCEYVEEFLRVAQTFISATIFSER